MPLRVFGSFCFLFLAVGLSTPSFAQTQFDTVTQASVPTGQRQSDKPPEEFQMTKSPWLAIGLSAVAPGAGQIYVEQWWKAPIIWAGIGGFLYGAFVQNKRYQYTKDSVVNQLARGDRQSAARYSGVREFYRDDRDKFFVYAGLVYVVNLLDAYVSANLFDFDVSDPVPTSGFLYDPELRQGKLQLSFRLP